MKFEDISKLADLVKRSGLSEIEVEEDGFRLRISNGEVRPLPPDPVPPKEPIITERDYIAAQDVSEVGKNKFFPEMAEQELYVVRSPMVGTFYSAPAPDAPNYVDRDSTVHPSTVVCIIEAMKVMNEIQADVEGVVVEILVRNGQTVEYGQPLFKIQKS